MRIALLGNMNNNHFALMRYLRRLGADAHLFLYQNDGRDSLAHFRPEDDTFGIDEWTPFIHRTSIHNGGRATLLQLAAAERLLRELDPYDYLIANGIAPALCYRAQRLVDIFLPYTVGGEHLNYRGSHALMNRAVFEVCRYFQARGIAENCKHVFTADRTEANLRHFNAIGRPTRAVAIPMVFVEQEAPNQDSLTDPTLLQLLSFSRGRRILFSHVSQVWDSANYMAQVKGNATLIRGFNQYLRSSSSPQFVLALSDYGPDVGRARSLIDELGIQSQVTWIPKLPRKVLLALLDHVDIGVSELGGFLWGGVGWEFIAKGVPFLHCLSMSASQFEDETGTPLPPFFNVQDAQQVAECLCRLDSGDLDRESISSSLKDWFSSYNGISLAAKYLDILRMS